MPGEVGDSQSGAFRSQYVLETVGGGAVGGARLTVDWRKLTVWLVVITAPWTMVALLVSALLQH